MAKILSSVPVYEQNKFTFSGSTQTFVAFISDFNGDRGIMARLYDDACDAGFGIKSKLTGRTIYFSLLSEDKNDEGDLVSYTYGAIVDHGSALKALKVVIFND
jgi:hypothetical protein